VARSKRHNENKLNSPCDAQPLGDEADWDRLRLRFHDQEVIKQEQLSDDEGQVPGEVIEVAIEDVFVTQRSCSSWFQNHRHVMGQTIKYLANGEINQASQICIESS
jgi:hypothetical protein